MMRCDECRFCGKKTGTIVVPGSRWRAPKIIDREGLECRKSRPGMSGFPVIHPDDWCGEFQSREPPPTVNESQSANEAKLDVEAKLSECDSPPAFSRGLIDFILRSPHHILDSKLLDIIRQLLAECDSEREACAAIVENWCGEFVRADIAKAIRERD